MRRRINARPGPRAAGFSLIFMSLFLTASAMLMVSFLPGKEAGSDNAKTISDVEKLQTVEEAMRSFMAYNGRRPCPADGQYPTSGPNTRYFGQEAGTPGTCQGNTAPTPNAPLGPDAGGNIVAGTIPTRSLALQSDYAFDSYGRRFTYVVDKRATATKTCRTLENYPYMSGKGGLTIKDIAGNTIDNVMYAYIQHGPSGYGAWPGDGTQATLSTAQSVARRINSGSTDKFMQVDAAVTPPGTSPGASDFSPDLTNILYKNSMTLPSTASGSLDTGFNDLLWYRDDIKNTCCLGQVCIPVGFRADGTNVSGHSGAAVVVGDFNGDGIPDLAISGPLSGGGGTKECFGSVFVVFGVKNAQNTGSIPDPLPLSSLNGSNGFRIDGVTYCDQVASSLAVGDVNGDGIADLIIGAYGATVSGISPSPGSAFVVFGGKGTWPASFSLSALNGNTGVNGTGGFRMNGVNPYDAAGMSVAAGNFHGATNGGNPISDVVIGAPGACCTAHPGKTYVVFGGTGAWPATFSLGSLAGSTGVNGTAGVEFDGIGAADASGFSVATGDINGDGTADVLISAEKASFGGAAYAVFGGSGAWSSPISLSALAGSTGVNGTGGFAVTNLGAGGSGVYVASGDINGDHIADFIIGAPWYSSFGKTYNGATYVIFGGTGAWASSVDATKLAGSTVVNGTNGVRIEGATALDHSGSAVASADINGDGIADLVIGADDASYTASNSGSAYVVFGSSAAWPATMSLSTLTGNNGFRLDGAAANYNTGWSVAAGDITGDGKAEVIVGSQNASPPEGSQAGSSYVLYGKVKWPANYNLGGL